MPRPHSSSRAPHALGLPKWVEINFEEEFWFWCLHFQKEFLEFCVSEYFAQKKSDLTVTCLLNRVPLTIINCFLIRNIFLEFMVGELVYSVYVYSFGSMFLLKVFLSIHPIFKGGFCLPSAHPCQKQRGRLSGRVLPKIIQINPRWQVVWSKQLCTLTLRFKKKKKKKVEIV